MIRALTKLLAVIAALVLTIWLVRDSMVFALRKADPITGRGRGCYTDLEIWLGVKQPTGWVRFAELVGAGTLAVSTTVVVVRWRRSE